MLYRVQRVIDAESQALLAYQQRTLEDYLCDLRSVLGWRLRAIRLVRPLLRMWLQGRSPYAQGALSGS